MNDTPPERPADSDPLDQEASEIDARSPQAADDIEDLIERAEELGRDPSQEVDPDAEPG